MEGWIDGLMVFSYAYVTNVSISRCYYVVINHPTPVPSPVDAHAQLWCTTITVSTKRSADVSHVWGSSVSMSHRGAGQHAAHSFSKLCEKRNIRQLTCMGNIGCNEILTEPLCRGPHRWSDELCVQAHNNNNNNNNTASDCKRESGNTAHNVVVVVAARRGNMAKVGADVKHLGTIWVTGLTH